MSESTILNVEMLSDQALQAILRNVTSKSTKWALINLDMDPAVFIPSTTLDQEDLMRAFSAIKSALIRNESNTTSKSSEKIYTCQPNSSQVSFHKIQE